MQSLVSLRRLALGVCAAWLALAPWPAAAAPNDRQMLDHFLRRFAFSAPPETVDQMLAAGNGAGWLAIADAWLAQQTSATKDVNSVSLQPPPSDVPVTGGTDDRDYEDGYIEHSIGTNLQLRAKLELHWLDHFSVTGDQSGLQEMMIYDAAVRANALGNFQTLLTKVAEQPAELYALSNFDNIGSNPATPPNVNFAREVMQIFTMGPFKLNMDGTQVLQANGAPASNYSDADILTLAYAMTGYTVGTDPSNPNPYEQVFGGFNTTNHYRGDPPSFQGDPLDRFLGRPFKLPKNADPIAYVAGLLARNPSTAPFQARELLQRFVMEDPPSAYVERIAAVWAANVDAPDQIALVVQAIVDDPLFPSSYHAMPKQPAEKLFGLLRQLPGTFAPLTAASGSSATAESGANMLRWEMSSFGQEIFYPNSVFSFYPPGNVEQANTEVGYINWANFINGLVGATSASNNGLWIDMPTLRRRIVAANKNSSSPAEITDAMVARYLTGAMLDTNPSVVDADALYGGSPDDPVVEVLSELGSVPTDQQIQTAIWLIAASPLYNVN